MSKTKAVQAYVIRSALLSFISPWRAAAVVLCDLGSTAFYIGGIVEGVIGKAAPWYILAVMIFSYGVRFVYIESCSVYVRGGVYRVVRDALGKQPAKIAVSALMFDYLLTGPISAVSAGKYLIGLVNPIFHHLNSNLRLPSAAGSVAIALAVTAYFWQQNVRGIESSSDKAMKILWAATAMIAVLVPWSIWTLTQHPFPSIPLAPRLDEKSLGWLAPWKDHFSSLGVVGLLVAFGHSMLAMSGEESLAQVYREMEAPKLRNLHKAGFIIFVYSLLLTALMTFLAVWIIPDAARLQFSDDLISGLALHLRGPMPLLLAMQAAVVLVGFALLSGAVNTSMVGANGVINRLDEDGLLPETLRRPHPKYGTTSRIVTLIALAQVAVILASWGNVGLLGEAYAFGVVWSFIFNTFAMLVRRFRGAPAPWKVPLNILVGGREWPVGMFLVFLVLISAGIVNLATKKLATTSGVMVTGVLFVGLTLAERLTKKRGPQAQEPLDRVNAQRLPALTPNALNLRQKNRTVIAMHDPNHQAQLEKYLSSLPYGPIDLIVVGVNIVENPQLLGQDRIDTRDGDILLTRIIRAGENVGRTMVPLLVHSTDFLKALVEVSVSLRANDVVMGLSKDWPAQKQLERFFQQLRSAKAPQGVCTHLIHDGTEIAREEYRPTPTNTAVN